MEVFRVLVVDDEEEMRNALVEAIQSIEDPQHQYKVKAFPCESFDAALEFLDERRIDLVILDLRLEGHRSDEEAGLKVLESIQLRTFVPVIFHTALPKKVEHLKDNRIIQVIAKGDGIYQSGLLDAINELLHSVLPKINRNLNKRVEEIQRDYLWQNSNLYPEIDVNSNQSRELFYSVARRLALSLSTTRASELIDEIFESDNNKVLSQRYYICPPIEKDKYFAGDIIKNNSGYFVVLTPSCDLVNNKAHYILLAKCLSINDDQRYKNWIKSSTIQDEKELVKLMCGNIPRYYYLPKLSNLIPHLVVDLQQLSSISKDDLITIQKSGWVKVASLDSPYGEALLTRFSHYFGRVGTPDLDTDEIINTLKNGQSKSI